MIRILLIADTHLGFDYPIQPRIHRRRRGDDFFANYRKALQIAVNNEVDAVVHGGDIFNRSRVHPHIVKEAYEPLQIIANQGIPVFIVPGNHERSRLPNPLFLAHPNIHTFYEPSTTVQTFNHCTILFAGIPFTRKNIRSIFPELLHRTHWKDFNADIKLLLIHQAMEGARVGIQNYTFRYKSDVIRIENIPSDFHAVLAGHIHRAQVITTKLDGSTADTPVIYPGSIERTSFVERKETKGYQIIEIDPHQNPPQLTTRFQSLYARPMTVIELSSQYLHQTNSLTMLKEKLNRLPHDSIIRLLIRETPSNIESLGISDRFLRSIVPHTMNIDFRLK